MAIRSPDDGDGASAPPAMTTEEARRWVRSVGGALVRQPARPDGGERWAALVRTPAAPGAKSRLIVGLGETPAGAAQMAELAWQEVWKTLSRAH
jgi:hypothetical protein